MANALVQALQCRAASTSISDSIDTARSRYGTDSVAARLLTKAAFGVGDLGADPDYRAASREFVELIRAKSLIGKIAAFRKIPFRIGVMRQVTAPVATWVAESGPVPVTTASLETERLEPRKLGLILPMTDELIRVVGADGEAGISRDLSRALAALESVSFIDPANAGASEVSPASITHGITPIASTGDARADVARLVDSFGGDLDTAILITSPAVAVQLYNAGFEGAGARGGDVAGLPLVTSSAVPTTSGGSIMVLIDPTRILLADDGVRLDISTETTLMIGAGAEAIATSLWQLNLTAVLGERYLNWLALPGAVAFVAGADYGTSP